MFHSIGQFAALRLFTRSYEFCSEERSNRGKISAIVIDYKITSTDGDAARSARIFKGNYDNENQHRYFVSILRLEAKDHAEHICGGVIIDSRYVLTAAHCVHNVDKTKLLVRSGFGDNPDQPFLEKKIYHKVLKVMYPKDYHSSSCRSHQYDIAVIKVLRKFDLADDRNFQKAYLPEYNSDYESEPATFVGYGAEKFALVPEVDNETANKVVFKYPIQLKYFSTVVMSPEECKNELNVIVTNDNICTQPKNLDGFSCVVSLAYQSNHCTTDRW